MKTYTYTHTVTYTQPMLEIRCTHIAENPRDSGNSLGYWINFSIFHEDIDINKKILKAMRDTRRMASSYENFAELIKKQYEKETGDKVLKVYPISVSMKGCEVEKYELAEFNDSNKNIVNFYFVTQRTARGLGAKQKNFKKIIEKEIQEYNDYINQKSYSFTLRTGKNTIVDYGDGFSSIQHIRKYLPQEWQNENLNDYLIR